MKDFKVAFVGLPSSGKSSIINSLIFKRKLQSGVCRTTTEYQLLEEIVIDDNGNKFRVIDFETYR
jgi:ribosome biogenesis GTPase A